MIEKLNRGKQLSLRGYCFPLFFSVPPPPLLLATAADKYANCSHAGLDPASRIALDTAPVFTGVTAGVALESRMVIYGRNNERSVTL